MPTPAAHPCCPPQPRNGPPGLIIGNAFLGPAFALVRPLFSSRPPPRRQRDRLGKPIGSLLHGWKFKAKLHTSKFLVASMDQSRG